MSDLTLAYNVLSNQEQKDQYDKSSTVVKKFNTKCKRLNNKNYYESVFEQKQPWMMLVFDNQEMNNHDQLSGFWNEFIQSNSFVNYGSMDMGQFNKGLK